MKQILLHVFITDTRLFLAREIGCSGIACEKLCSLEHDGEIHSYNVGKCNYLRCLEYEEDLVKSAKLDLELSLLFSLPNKSPVLSFRSLPRGSTNERSRLQLSSYYIFYHYFGDINMMNFSGNPIISSPILCRCTT
ncbi:hypothetical protein KGM_208551 [Danaus plexippus plexippus]|uniref:Uncharacterized protein n=1 Tax=Danaus plexippus plexippus TaxID=278856 RepID=A0A212F3I9_DANPL|nr:hypothetical protein KGM_208551 [Danaus plexippus plexippus]